MSNQEELQIHNLCTRINPERLGQLTFELTKIPSPTGHERQVSEFYADHLRQVGLEVELDETIPDSPNVIARLKGRYEGPTLQLSGHADSIPVEHTPPRYENGVVHGRGALDMKQGLAVMAEVARIFKETGLPEKGDLLLTSYGLHEAPYGDGRGLRFMLERGVKGDAVIVTEGPIDCVYITGKGMAIVDFHIHRPGPAEHELAATNPAHAVQAGVDLINELNCLAEELAKVSIPMLTPESIFIGKFHGGDWYNRFPITCDITITRRWGPDKSSDSVKAELQEICKRVATRQNVQIDTDFQKVGDSYKIAADEDIVIALQRAHRIISGIEAPLRGASFITDAPRFVNWGNVPAVIVGPSLESAHSDNEFVHQEAIARSAKTVLATALYYFNRNFPHP